MCFDADDGSGGDDDTDGGGAPGSAGGGGGAAMARIIDARCAFNNAKCCCSASILASSARNCSSISCARATSLPAACVADGAGDTIAGAAVVEDGVPVGALPSYSQPNHHINPGTDDSI